MENRLIACIACFFLPFTAQAEIYSTKEGKKDCVELPDYESDDSVEYKPNESVDGWAVAPADISPNPFGEGAFDKVQMGLNIPMEPFAPDLDNGGSDARRDLSESEIGLGVLEVERNGVMSFNGKEIKSQPYAVGDGCE